MNAAPSTFAVATSSGGVYPEHMIRQTSDGADAAEIRAEAAGAEAGGGAGSVRFEAEAESPVNFEESALVELEIEGTDYRIDSGRAGTALCISTRVSGSWGWQFRGEARWQANVLRCKSFDRPVLTELGQALAAAAAAVD